MVTRPISQDTYGNLKKSFIVWDASSKYLTQKMLVFFFMPSFLLSISVQPNVKGNGGKIIGGKHHRGVSLTLLHILLSSLSRTHWAGSLLHFNPNFKSQVFLRKILSNSEPRLVLQLRTPSFLCSNLHTCYSPIHCNDWLSAVAKNMDFGVRLPRFKFHLLHLLFVWP